MIDPRRLQRALFRAQMDPGFGDRLFAREDAAVESARLTEEELELFLLAPRAAVHADPGGTRRLQVLGNATLEFRLSLAASGDPRGMLHGFAVSEEFHDAIANDGHLPLAAGHYLTRALAGNPLAHAIARLELRLAELRRQPAGPTPPPGKWQRAHRAAVLTLPAGSLAAAQQLQQALQAGETWTRPPLASSGEEALLVYAKPITNRWQWTDAVPEAVNEAVAGLFEAAVAPMGPAELEAYAAPFGATAADLEPLMQEYREDGALVFGG